MNIVFTGLLLLSFAGSLRWDWKHLMGGELRSRTLLWMIYILCALLAYPMLRQWEIPMPTDWIGNNVAPWVQSFIQK